MATERGLASWRMADPRRRGIAPMKAVAGTLPVNTANEWVFEVKWDGFRTIAFIDGGVARLQSSNLLDATHKWPALAGLADAVHATSAVLDGEVVVFDDAGRPSFGRLARGEGTPTFVVFDLLALNGVDTTELTLAQRRSLLEQAFEPGPHWLLSPQYDDGAALAAATEARGMEGVMAKRRDSRYVPGKRSPSWRKVKHRLRQELVIGGWQAGEGNRSNTFASLIVGVHDAGRLRFCGAVGTGFDERALRTLTALLAERATDVCPFEPRPDRTKVTRPRWVTPDLVCEVAFAEWTDDHIIRHAAFVGLRDDKDPRDVVRET